MIEGGCHTFEIPETALTLDIGPILGHTHTACLHEAPHYAGDATDDARKRGAQASHLDHVLSLVPGGDAALSSHAKYNLPGHPMVCRAAGRLSLARHAARTDDFYIAHARVARAVYLAGVE